MSESSEQDSEHVSKIRRLAHEFSNQMCVVLSYSELLKDRLGQPNASLYVEHIHTAAQRSSDLLNDLLALTVTDAPESAPAEFSAAPAATTAPLKKLRILAAEDEDVLRYMLTEMLSASGHDVLAAADGRETLELYRAQPHQFDLVILDMKMPLLDGKDVFHAMRQINPSIKVIMLTGTSLNAEIKALFKEGLLGYLHKPYSKQQLDDLLSKVTQP
jgi:CheY-like chemotaxis protein